MKIAMAQINPIIGDFKHNAGNIRRCVARAQAAGCDLIVFSELVVSGYPPRDLLEKNDFVEANLACLERLVTEIRGIGVICGTVARNPATEGNSLCNAVMLFEDGRILHQAYKRLLPTYDVFDEGRYFEPGTVCEAVAYKGRRLGITICEDAWNDKDIMAKRIYHLDPLARMVADGADLLINIAASPFYAGKDAFRSNLLSSIARKYQTPLVFANQVGGNDSVLFDGNSAAFDRSGRVVAQARDFEEDLVICRLGETDFESVPEALHPVSGSINASILKALVMGTRDYVRKCGFTKVVLGLSGGIDSALTACIAVRALGKQNVSALFMPSRYTSRENYEDTRLLSENLGIPLTHVPVDGIFDAFLQPLSPAFNERDPGIMEQNLQARIRGSILMAFSNRDGSLLLSTGNKSELAVGYCTLYGDMNGGLAVIADVPKTVVYELARLINTEGAVIPEPIITKIPSAELKPDQTDQDDLPPYDVLDRILKGYIEDFKGVADLVAMGFAEKLVRDVVARVDRNEYKRHQAAPCLKVTSKAFGYGRRYPLAQRYTPGIAAF